MLQPTDSHIGARWRPAALSLPLFVLPGNHDDRATLRRRFDVPGEGSDPIQYAVELDGLRVLMLDTVRPGEPGGELGSERLSLHLLPAALDFTAAGLAMVAEPPAFAVHVLVDGRLVSHVQTLSATAAGQLAPR